MKTAVKRTTGVALGAACAALALVAGQAGTAAAADGAPAAKAAAPAGPAAQGADAARAATTVAFTAGSSAPAFAVQGQPPGPVYSPRGPGCEGGPTDPCGIVYNRHGHTLQIARDSSSHWSCSDPKHFRNLPSGKNSNTYGSPNWPDVDCFRDKKHWIVTNGRPYPPGEWIRVWTAKWVY